MNSILNLFGWHLQTDYEVQIQDSQGDFRMWNDGFGSLKSASENMSNCIVNDVRFNNYIKGVFRVQKRVSFIRYYQSNQRQ